ncbi:uncharacterized protein LOC62_02G002903 [Vanrija pseudolonga]|uniref:Uncharacterized protein n=1 Tax=Vanrija pseudolonga TaxID=143232 RepID=A0AAF1BKA3_9TREE|nr:hypothetical protein LOC62_02G002903 [Vanrija pseudolonga]
MPINDNKRPLADDKPGDENTPPKKAKKDDKDEGLHTQLTGPWEKWEKACAARYTAEATMHAAWSLKMYAERHYNDCATLFQKAGSLKKDATSPFESIAILSEALQISQEAASIKDQSDVYWRKQVDAMPEAEQHEDNMLEACMGKWPIESTSAAAGAEDVAPARPPHGVNFTWTAFDDDFKAIHRRLMTSIDRANRVRGVRR